MTSLAAFAHPRSDAVDAITGGAPRPRTATQSAVYAGAAAPLAPIQYDLVELFADQPEWFARETVPHLLAWLREPKATATFKLAGLRALAESKSADLLRAPDVAEGWLSL